MSWDRDGDGSHDSDSQARSQAGSAAKSDSLQSISSFAWTRPISDFFAPSSGATVLGVTRGVARHLVPGASRPRDPPGRQSRSPPSGSMSPSFAPRVTIALDRTFSQSCKDRRLSFTTDHPDISCCSTIHLAITKPFALPQRGWRAFIRSRGYVRGAVFERINRLYVQSRYSGLVPLDAPARRRGGRWGLPFAPTEHVNGGGIGVINASLMDCFAPLTMCLPTSALADTRPRQSLP